MGANILGYADAVMHGDWPGVRRDLERVMQGLPTREARKRARIEKLKQEAHELQQNVAAKAMGLL